ncbi:MAG: undecaprenyldiphospho-muramoylpentapeptide beta-N-acetylglucosaminyltransferase [Candidatus Cloacimonadaceae bacterium]
MRLLIGAGGTGGHIIPAIAVALELAAQGWQVHFVGNRNRMEETLVSKYGFDFLPINVQKLYRRLTLAHLKFPFLFMSSIAKSVKYIIKVKPDAVLCTGGFVSGPVAVASIILRRRLYFQDGNSYPGLTTRVLSHYTQHIFIASERARNYLQKANCIMTGNPILKYSNLDLNSVDWSSYNLRPDSRKLFIIGGSQGSVIINKVVSECVKELLSQNIELIWQTGKNYYPRIHDKFAGVKGVHCFDFTDKMSEYYQLADFAISRAGALSIAELQEHALPAVFIPLPSAAENHQYINAVAQAEKGLGLVLEQSDLTPKTLMESIQKLSSKYQEFKTSFSAMPGNNATQLIAEIISREVNLHQEIAC